MDYMLYDYEAAKAYLLDFELPQKGIYDRAVLDAMKRVPRDKFVPEHLKPYAYVDQALPIDEGQTISQPYIVALMAQELHLNPTDCVLDVGTGSGYAAAVLSRLVSEVYSIERHASLAKRAQKRLQALGYHNIHIRHGDGWQGWQDAGPFQAISVAAASSQVPPSLLQQLAIGGRLIMPIEDNRGFQTLVLILRTGEDSFEKKELGGVSFVPLVKGMSLLPPSRKETLELLQDELSKIVESFDSIEEANLSPLIGRIGDCRVVLLGESTHGTAHFYDMRAKITKELIEQKGFNLIAIEADWPDAALIDQYIRHKSSKNTISQAFSRFPSWMWSNAQMQSLVQWLYTYNKSHSANIRLLGLDLYSLSSSISAVLRFLQDKDLELAELAKERYSCLFPWINDPIAYGAMALRERYRACQSQVVAMLCDLYKRELKYAEQDPDQFLDALQNAKLLTKAERYYRVLYESSRESWNLRDQYMFDTLLQILSFMGPSSKAIVWAHNTHVGDASATQMGDEGEYSIGQLCRNYFGDKVYVVGFGTALGKVAAASYWGGPVNFLELNPPLEGSYEHFFQSIPHHSFLLPLKHTKGSLIFQKLQERQLERAIGVVYNPHNERYSHYFNACLTKQFDEFIWFKHSLPITPFQSIEKSGFDTFPLGL